MGLSGVFAGWREALGADPLIGLAVAGAVLALAATPIAFAILGRTKWFEARRGRTYLRPAFWSVVCSMLLVMGIPAIFGILAIKSRQFDRDRYEFDPNQTISVLDQGRQYRTLKEADNAVRAERERLDGKEKDLLNAVRKLDEAMLALRAAAMTNPATYQALPTVLDRLATIHQAVGLDAPQQLIDLTAPPAALAGSGPAPLASPVAAPVVPAGNGLSAAEAQAELATVPEPQRKLAGLLPLAEVPVGWRLGKPGDKHLETFSADNMYEKIDGRAESFIQYDVQGMAYAFYQPVADDSAEAQLYAFEFTDALKAFGKYGSEKPEGVARAENLGSDGYTSAGSVFFYSGPYYVQIVTTSDDPKFAAFALDLAHKVAARIQPAGPTEVAESGHAVPAATPEALFKLLPAGPGRTGEKYVAQDVFGYSFFTDVFLADYSEGGATWQGFVRPYATPAEAAATFEKYLAEVQDFGAQLRMVETSDAQKMASSTLDGLVDVVFLKGNAVAGANGSTDPARAMAFSESFARTLPAQLPAPAGGTPAAPAHSGSH